MKIFSLGGCAPHPYNAEGNTVTLQIFIDLKFAAAATTTRMTTTPPPPPTTTTTTTTTGIF
jgi:hypothetical protein